MKAAVYHDRRDVRVEDVDEPTSPAGGEVLVTPLWCGICGTDVHIYNWDAWARKTIPVPMVVGHEFVGRIERVGDLVSVSKVTQ